MHKKNYVGFTCSANPNFINILQMKSLDTAPDQDLRTQSFEANERNLFLKRVSKIYIQCLLPPW